MHRAGGLRRRGGGGGTAATRRLTARLQLSADLVVEGTTVATESGALTVLAVSSAPRVGLRAGRALHGELAIGLRTGIARMRGVALLGDVVVGRTLVRPWLGPAATAAVGYAITPRITATASAELGAVLHGATARDLGTPIASLDGAWIALAVAAVIAL